METKKVKSGNIFKDLGSGLLTVIAIAVIATIIWIGIALAPFMITIVIFFGYCGIIIAAIVGAVWLIGKLVNKAIDKK